MKCKLLFIVLLLSVWLQTISSQSVRYFRKVDIGIDYFKFKPKYEIDKSVYQYQNCYKVEFDKNGKIKYFIFLNKGKPAVDQYYKVCCIKFSYTPNTESRTYYDTQGKRMSYRGIYKKVLSYNQPDVIETSNYNLSDSLIANEDSVMFIHWKLDAQNRIVRESYFGKNNRQVVDKNGYYFISFKRNQDKDGITLEKSYFNSDSQLITNKYNYAVSLSRIEPVNEEIIGIRYFDENHNPKSLVFTGAAGVSKFYNGQGCLIEQNYLDKNNNLHDTPQGYAKICFQYNRFNNLTNVRFFDQNNKPTTNGKSVVAGYTYQYDEQQNLTEERYWNLNGKLINNYQGIAMISYQYNSQGRKINQYLYDDKMSLIKDSFCRIHWKYDTPGNMIEESHFDAMDKLVENKNGTAIIRWKYNVEGELYQTEYYDSQNKLLNK
ncbi:MAG: hypothetical protein PHH37_01915 [Paludibacter sp.]|nr:hypothetical protein [Paludibacter sp.]